ncbi:glutathione S-transferase family protein [Caulobacter sp.]|uniref:glutathione S-transferase family protein n=1 Tax=Caulobacter sp. TaxID=78 RepID=UPI001B285174|nr:glutathione S-transferase family protein [Caulobacter sp.]MBO9547628.1 glutathione S-transferase family protein [Caulobacter sp.]
MSLTLHAHPLSSFCWKALIGLYEMGPAFENAMVNLGDPAAREAFLKLSPMGKMPALQDDARGETVLESSVILEYLDLHYPGAVRLVPADADAALQARYWDRFFDHYVHHPMQRIIADRLRPPEAKDGFGVDEAYSQLAKACDHLETVLADGRTWISGDFGLADCAALPALFYADKVQAFEGRWLLCLSYLERLKARPSVQRVLTEAEPFFKYFPAQ